MAVGGRDQSFDWDRSGSQHHHRHQFPRTCPGILSHYLFLNIFSLGIKLESPYPWQLRFGASTAVLSKTSDGIYPTKKAGFTGLTSVSSSGLKEPNFRGRCRRCLRARMEFRRVLATWKVTAGMCSRALFQWRTSGG